jgi:RNA polymerase sigma-70 factor (ECF subfamily)
MLAAVPGLRAFAISLSGNVDRADDLVQETLLRAVTKIDSFQPGSHMSAWLITILRNLFRTEYRKRRREVEDATAVTSIA